MHLQIKSKSFIRKCVRCKDLWLNIYFQSTTKCRDEGAQVPGLHVPGITHASVSGLRKGRIKLLIIPTPNHYAVNSINSRMSVVRIVKMRIGG